MEMQTVGGRLGVGQCATTVLIGRDNFDLAEQLRIALQFGTMQKEPWIALCKREQEWEMSQRRLNGRSEKDREGGKAETNAAVAPGEETASEENNEWTTNALKLSFKLFSELCVNVSHPLLPPNLKYLLTYHLVQAIFWGERELGKCRRDNGPGGEMKGRDLGRKLELEVAKGRTPLPLSLKHPRTLRDVGRDLSFMPFLRQGFEQNSFISQELGLLQKVGGPCKGRGGQECGNAGKKKKKLLRRVTKYKC